MRAIVIGGAGFIGSYLSEELVRRGYDIPAGRRNRFYV